VERQEEKKRLSGREDVIDEMNPMGVGCRFIAAEEQGLDDDDVVVVVVGDGGKLFIRISVDGARTTKERRVWVKASVGEREERECVAHRHSAPMTAVPKFYKAPLRLSDMKGRRTRAWMCR
jgi:hypothetical protein